MRFARARFAGMGRRRQGLELGVYLELGLEPRGRFLLELWV
jgi:hypothetical protein